MRTRAAAGVGINGGFNGFKHRMEKFACAARALGVRNCLIHSEVGSYSYEKSQLKGKKWGRTHKQDAIDALNSIEDIKI